MTVDPDLLALLRCPQSGQTLSVADAGTLARAQARQAEQNVSLKGEGKAPVTEDLTAALLRADEKLVYPVRCGIPVLLLEEAITF